MAIKVLVIDDSVITLQAMALRLGQAGIEVIGLESSDGLARIIRTGVPDLVLLDVSMPGSGPEAVVRELRGMKDVHGIPILLHSDRDEGELEELVRQSGADGHLRKTADRDRIVQTIERFLARA